MTWVYLLVIYSIYKKLKLFLNKITVINVFAKSLVSLCTDVNIFILRLKLVSSIFLSLLGGFFFKLTDFLNFLI